MNAHASRNKSYRRWQWLAALTLLALAAFPFRDTVAVGPTTMMTIRIHRRRRGFHLGGVFAC